MKSRCSDLLTGREAFRKILDRRLKYLFSDIPGIGSLIKSQSLNESVTGYQRVASQGTATSLNSFKRVGPKLGLIQFPNVATGDSGQESDMKEEENIIKQYMKKREEVKLKKIESLQKPTPDLKVTPTTQPNRSNSPAKEPNPAKANLAKFINGPTQVQASSKSTPSRSPEVAAGKSTSKERSVDEEYLR
jgi:hypothetical protein